MASKRPRALLTFEQLAFIGSLHTQLVEDKRGQHITPTISIRGKMIEVVPSFKYLGLRDTEDGTLETWNYTTTDIARIERHYFRLLRDVLLMPRTALSVTIFISVMDYAAQQHGIVEIFPMESLIQRQQLKFLWKMVHLEDTAIQKIVLFGNISSQYNGRKGGRKKTYISCLMLALANFGVTMEECMEMLSQLDWEFHINNQALLDYINRELNLVHLSPKIIFGPLECRPAGKEKGS